MMKSPNLLGLVIALAGCVVQDGLPIFLSSSERARVYEAVYVHKRALELFEEGNSRDAIAVAEKAAELFERALGSTHPHLAIPLRSLAVFHQAEGAYAKAAPLYARVIAIREKDLSPTDERLVQSLDELAGLYMQWGAYGKAQPLYARSLAIRQRALGPNDRQVVASLNNLALALEKQGAYRQAEALYHRAVAIAEKALGPRDPDVARGLNGLAMLYWTEGTYDRAEPLLVRALEIREGLVLELDHLGTTGSISAGGNMFSNYETIPRKGATRRAAESTLLGVFSTSIQLINSITLESISNLDQLYSAVSPNAMAEPLLSRTGDVFETVVKLARSDAAQSRDDLAQLYVDRGEYQRAESLLTQALDTREKTLGTTHPDVANSLNNMAQLYQTQGAYAKAAKLLLRVLDIRIKALGKRHADVARALNNLALVYRIQGAYAEAESLLLRAQAMLEDILGGSHPDVARSLNNLALLYHEQGAYATAEPLYLRAIDIASKTPKGMRLEAVRYRNNLGVLYHANGAPEKAEPLMAVAAEMRDSELPLDLARLSASRKRALMVLMQQETESLVSLHADSTPASVPAFELALTTVLRRKGLTLESLVANQATLREHLTPYLRSKLDELAAASNELAKLLHSPIESRPVTVRRSAIAALRARIDVLESALNTASSELRGKSQLVKLADIQKALPQGAALIEFVRYHRFDPRPDQQRWQEARYVVYVIQRTGSPQWFSLGEAGPIDAGVDAVLAGMRRDAGVEAARIALRHLDELLLGPLRSQLANISHILISPDSKLSLLPFEALIDPQGRYELESRLISYVASGRDLLLSTTRPAPRSPPTFVAAPDFGPGKLFAPLPNARAEAVEASTYFPGAKILASTGATKAALSIVVGPAVLHIATHGFFARRPGVASMPAPARPLGWTAVDPGERGMFVEAVLTTPSSSRFEDPGEALEQVGLALANANISADGIVSAREIMNYDWWGTRLVVLSACSTGVGAVPSSDGVYGLRRAIALAGAESQVVSLWNVSDSSAREIMRKFYDELARGTGRAEALRRAKLWMLQQAKFSHPYYWAAFIPAGQWTPLDRTVKIQQRHSRR